MKPDNRMFGQKIEHRELHGLQLVAREGREGYTDGKICSNKEQRGAVEGENVSFERNLEHP